MNILFINTSDNSGGAARLAWDLGNELIKSGHNVRYLVGRKINTSINSEQICKHIFPTIAGKDFDLFIKQMFSFVTANDICSNSIFSEKIFRHRWYKEADIIHLHNLHGNYIKLDILKRICREKKVVWTLHDMWALTGHCAHSFDCNFFQTGCKRCPNLSIYFPILWDNSSNLLKRKSKIYEHSSFNLVTPSKWLATKVSKSILCSKPLIMIPNGVDTKVFRFQDKLKIREELGIPKNKKVIVTVGQGGKSNQFKGSYFFEEIANRNKDFLFISVGGDVGVSENIIGTGYISDQNLLSMYYSSADVFLFPSLAENCPLAVLEAMSCGVPVLAFNVGGIPELVKHRINGYIAEYKNLSDLNSGLLYLLGLEHEKLVMISKTNIKDVNENYGISRMAGEYIELYKSIA